MARGKAWTADEDWTIKDMVEKGLGSTIIGEAIGRSRDGVRKRIRQLGLNEQVKEEVKPVENIEPDQPGKYKIRYLIDGVQEKTVWVTAKSEQRAIKGLIKELNSKDETRTFDIVKVEEFKPMVETPSSEMAEKVKKFAEIIESVNDGARKKNDEELVKEIQQGIEERFEQKEEDKTMECKDGVCEVKRDWVGELKEVLEERSVKPVEYVAKELTKEELPVAYYDCDGCLTVKGITLNFEETQKVLLFATQMWKSM